MTRGVVDAALDICAAIFLGTNFRIFAGDRDQDVTLQDCALRGLAHRLGHFP